MAAHRLGLLGEAARQLRGVFRHRVLRDEKGPPSPAGPGGMVRWFRLFGSHCRRIGGGRLILVRGLGFGHGRFVPSVAVSAPAGSSVAILSSAVAVEAAASRRLRSACAAARAASQCRPAASPPLSAISPFLRCSMRSAARCPFASATACRMRALVTRPRKLSTVGFHPAAAMSRSTACASRSAWANARGRRFQASCTALTDRLTTVGEQAGLAVAVPPLQRVPEIGRLLRQRLRPALVPNADRLGRGAVVQPRRLGAEADALQVEFQAAIRAVVVEDLQRQGVQRREEGDVRPLAERVAQAERAVRGQLGHQPVGERRQALVLLRLGCGLGSRTVWLRSPS